MSGKPRCTVCGRMMTWRGDDIGWECSCEEFGSWINSDLYRDLSGTPDYPDHGYWESGDY